MTCLPVAAWCAALGQRSCVGLSLRDSLSSRAGSWDGPLFFPLHKRIDREPVRQFCLTRSWHALLGPHQLALGTRDSASGSWAVPASRREQSRSVPSLTPQSAWPRPRAAHPALADGSQSGRGRDPVGLEAWAGSSRPRHQEIGLQVKRYRQITGHSGGLWDI